MEELGKDSIRLLKLLQVVVGLVRTEMESSKLAVIQATNLFKKLIGQVSLLSNNLVHLILPADAIGTPHSKTEPIRRNWSTLDWDPCSFNGDLWGSSDQPRFRFLWVGESAWCSDPSNHWINVQISMYKLFIKCDREGILSAIRLWDSLEDPILPVSCEVWLDADRLLWAPLEHLSHSHLLPGEQYRYQLGISQQRHVAHFRIDLQRMDHLQGYQCIASLVNSSVKWLCSVW